MALLKQTAFTFADAPLDWPEDILAELRVNDRNGYVGQLLLAETERVRVWSTKLAPRERLPFHRHVLDYFLTALEAGRARSRYGDGAVRFYEYTVGETIDLRFSAGESLIHDLTNVGDAPISFITVEFRRSANTPLKL